jgi:hypothetical protein
MEEDQPKSYLDYSWLYKKIFELKMMELFEEPSAYEDEICD